MKTNKLKFATAAFALAALFTACSPDEYGSGNGLVNEETLDASFTYSNIDGSPNRVRFQAPTSGRLGVMADYWSKSAASPTVGRAHQDYFFPLGGTYTITHKVCGLGGDCVSTSQDIVIPSDDPIAWNRIQGGSFDTPADVAEWTILVSNPNSVWNFSGGQASLTGTAAWAQSPIYQAVEVEGGHNYMFDMHISGPALVDSFFELYADYTVPNPGSDYTAGGKVLQINTWGGCGLTPFSGQLAVLTCDTPGMGIKYFPEDGTVYVVMRGGSGVGNFQATIDDVEMRRID